MLLRVPLSLVSACLIAQAASAPAPPLDFETLKTRIQPMFLAKRPGHARCYACHAGSGGTRYLQKLSPGAAAWDEAQSRKNFDEVARLIAPGAPEKSRLLTRPLDAGAGGDEFHGGGKHWATRDHPEWRALAAWVRGEAAASAAAAMADRHVRIVQTNSAGDSVHLIDPATNTIVAEIPGIEANHGAAASPDGSRLYVTNEAESSLDVVDVRALKVVTRIPLSGHPNNLSISPDGKRVYVAIAEAPGAVDVIDTPTAALAKTLPIQGAGHNTFVTPDGRYFVAGSVAGRTLTVFDAKTEAEAWMMKFDGGVRPIAFEKKPDGSTGRMFVQISEVHGFAVVDFATHKELSRVTLPDPPGVEKNLSGIQGSPSHGIGITPDGKTLWATSKWYHFVAAYSMPDLTPLGIVPVGHHPDWLTFSPDSRSVYVACAGSNAVSVVDVATMKEVGRIPVGQVPKRNITALLQ